MLAGAPRAMPSAKPGTWVRQVRQFVRRDEIMHGYYNHHYSGFRTRPMVCFVNVESVDRFIYAIFNGYNEQHDRRNRTLRLFTQAA